MELAANFNDATTQDFFHVWDNFGDFDLFDSIAELEAEEDIFWTEQ